MELGEIDAAPGGRVLPHFSSTFPPVCGRSRGHGAVRLRTEFSTSRGFAEPKLRVLDSCWAREKRSPVMYWLSGAMRCLKDAGWARCWAHQIWCGLCLDSGLTVGKIFAFLVTIQVKVRLKVKTVPFPLIGCRDWTSAANPTFVEMLPKRWRIYHMTKGLIPGKGQGQVK